MSSRGQHMLIQLADLFYVTFKRIPQIKSGYEKNMPYERV